MTRYESAALELLKSSANPSWNVKEKELAIQSAQAYAILHLAEIIDTNN